MTLVTLTEAKTKLGELIKQAAEGEEVVITNEDGRGFKLVPLPQSVNVPKFGIAHGMIWMADDFDLPLPEFEEYGP